MNSKKLQVEQKPEISSKINNKNFKQNKNQENELNKIIIK